MNIPLGAVVGCNLESDIDPVEQRHLADNYSSVIQHRLNYATHNADHIYLNPAQRLAVQHLREQLNRLLRKRDAYLAFIDSVDDSPMGLGKKPNAHQQDIAYELTQSFFDQVYATLSALASVHGRIRLYPDLQEAPINSNERFLEWWDKVNAGGFLDGPLELLAAARDFRTVFVHPAQWPLFDWKTHGTPDHILVTIYGSESSRGNIPQGATRLDDGVTWEFEAPPMDGLLWAFERLCGASFAPIFTWYPPEEGVTACTWEPDGVGSSIGDAAASSLRDALAANDFDPRVRAMLAPGIIDELDAYIDAMRGIRKSADATPLPSSMRTGLPAARASLDLGPPFGIEPDASDA